MKEWSESCISERLYVLYVPELNRQDLLSPSDCFMRQEAEHGTSGFIFSYAWLCACCGLIINCYAPILPLGSVEIYTFSQLKTA